MQVALATDPVPEEESAPDRPEVTLTDDSPVVTMAAVTAELPFALALEERYSLDESTGEIRRMAGAEPGDVVSPTMSVNWGFFTLDTAVTLFPVPHTDGLFDDPPE